MLEKYEKKFELYIRSEMVQDPAHDIDHVRRVVKTAKELCDKEGAKLEVVLPAAYLHDCFTFPKNHPKRASSSIVAAEKAEAFLISIDYPKDHLAEIKHAIVAHSFSLGVKPDTIEAQIVQDADRLDALGAIGISRCIQVSAGFGSSLYHSEDPYAESRALDDKAYALDHFQVKLFKIAEQMNTASARQEAEKRVRFMELYIDQLGSEIHLKR
ncbi:HD domain-containing protein [Maridesulfovibrio sp.]|uniref:HD domain-containing protein n=1 Tax=Maridesulfovibrio sp. TaxID=2795000 RepID=UPI0029F5B144|nr:HD domain-containing protein [Maridesulfovibrio sp.]